VAHPEQNKVEDRRYPGAGIPSAHSKKGPEAWTVVIRRASKVAHPKPTLPDEWQAAWFDPRGGRLPSAGC